MSDFSTNGAPPDPRSSLGDGRRQFIAAAVGFLLPLAIFFCWFFFFRSVNFAFVLAALLLLIVVALVCGARFKSSRVIAIGSTWLFTGCLGALFWALLINGMP